MSGQRALAAGLTAYERLLYHVIPELLSGCGCDGARRDLEDVIKSKDAGSDDIVDALDAAGEMALWQAAHQLPKEAERTELIRNLICHLAQHDSLQGKSDIASRRHLQRAIAIAETLGRKVGPVMVVPS